MRIPRGPIVASILVVAVVVQTTLFAQVRPIAPDLVLLVAILFGLTRIRPELVLLIAFSAGLLVDLLGSTLIGLRAVVFTTVAYAAVRTRGRAELGRLPTAIWAGVHTFFGLALLVIIGTLFGQTNLVGPDIGLRMIMLPVANLVLAALIAPFFVRLVDRDTGIFHTP
jgi:rod shape-determining protein MreD